MPRFESAEPTPAAAEPRAVSPWDALVDAVFAQSPISVSVHDAAGRLVRGNAAYERHFGIRLADVPADYSLLTDPQLRDAGLLPLIERAYAGETVVLPAVCYDAARATAGAGRAVWTEAQCFPLRDADGRVMHVAIAHVDVTARIETEVALRTLNDELAMRNAQLQEQGEKLERSNEQLHEQAVQLEQQVAHALQAMHDAAAARAVAEAAAARTALLQDLTAALSRAVTPEDVAEVVVDQIGGRLDASLCVLALVTSDAPMLRVAAANRLQGETRREWETFALSSPVPLAEAAREARPIVLRSFAEIADHAPAIADLCRRSGTQAMCVVPVLAADGAVLGAIGLSFAAPRDFDAVWIALVQTIAQQAAQALERARLFAGERDARLEAERERVAAHEANLAKSEFLSTMSHELRTPLNAIAGYAELLALGLRGPLTDSQAQDLARIRRANQHLMGLITDILNFARIEAGQVELHLEEVDLGPLIRDLEAFVGPQLAAKGLSFSHDACEPDTPERPHVVRADPEKVRQILLNLLVNAIKFTDSGGSVAIECALDRDAGVVRTSVSDSGRGIRPEQLSRIFEPFVQVDRRGTQDSQQGVGLGLAISRDLARAMEGELTVTSEPGAGSVFTLVLPMA